MVRRQRGVSETGLLATTASVHFSGIMFTRNLHVEDYPDSHKTLRQRLPQE